MVNLLSETEFLLKYCKKLEEDVAYVTDGENRCTWEDFKKEAKNVNYNAFHGDNNGCSINQFLKIVGKTGWWFVRTDYDGLECWNLITIPKKKETKKGKVWITTPRYRFLNNEDEA